MNLKQDLFDDLNSMNSALDKIYTLLYGQMGCGTGNGEKLSNS